MSVLDSLQHINDFRIRIALAKAGDSEAREFISSFVESIIDDMPSGLLFDVADLIADYREGELQSKDN